MILKGSQRAGACDLATHLLNAHDNETVEVAQIKGTVADDLHGAFAEFAAIATGTRCKKHLYSLSLNPSAPITREQYSASIDRAEERLGLKGQPRAVVFHCKHGREHAHVVWSRIDIKTMRAIRMSHDYPKLRTVARELAAKYGLQLPPGMQIDRATKHSDNSDITLAESNQANQTAITPQDRRADITHAYRTSENPDAFNHALETRGYFLAIGDRRAFVVVDRYGHIHSLARQIEGVRTKALKTFLQDFEPYTLDEANRLTRQRYQATQDYQREKTKAKLDQTLAQLEQAQARRRQTFAQQELALTALHLKERTALAAAHRRERGKRLPRIFSAVLALFKRIPALRSVLAHITTNPHFSPLERRRLEPKALRDRHEREQLDFQRQMAVLSKLEKRERVSATTAVTRAIRATDHKLEMFAVNAHDITAPSLRSAEDDHPLTEDLDPVEAQIERDHALCRYGLSPFFGASAGVENPYRTSGESTFQITVSPDPPSDDEPMDPVEAEIAREHTLLQYGLTPFFNSSAGISKKRETEDQQGLDISDPYYQP